MWAGAAAAGAAARGASEKTPENLDNTFLIHNSLWRKVQLKAVSLHRHLLGGSLSNKCNGERCHDAVQC